MIEATSSLQDAPCRVMPSSMQEYSHSRNAAKKHGLQRLCYHEVEACCLLDGIDGGVCT